MPFPLVDHVAAVVDNVIYVMAGASYSGGRANRAVAAYNPVSDSWEMKASMPRKNRNPSACVLHGKIYVVEGREGRDFIEYDPKTNKWTAKAPAPGHYPDNAVCVGSSDGLLYLTKTDAIYAYDPGKNAWSRVESAGGTASTMIGSVIYAVEPEVKSLELGDLDWKTLTPPPQRMEGLAVATNSRLYLIGGGKFSRPLRGVLEYDPASNQWTPKSPMNYSVQRHAVAAVDGTLYVIGGSIGGGSTVPYVEAYTPAADYGENPTERRPEKRSSVSPQWQPAGPLPTPRSALSIGSGCGYPATIGGEVHGKIVPNVEVYHPADSWWLARRPLKVARRYAGAACLNAGKTLYVAGGQDAKTDLKSVEVFSFAESSDWEMLAPLSSPRSKLGLIGANGKVYAIGGERNGKMTNIVEAYDPATKRWSKQPPVPAPVAPRDAVTTDGRIISVYAEASSPYCFKRIYQYDTVYRVWKTSESLPTPSCIMGWRETTVSPRRRYDFQMAEFADSYYAMGGRDERGEIEQVDELLKYSFRGTFDYWISSKETEQPQPAVAPSVKRKSWRPHDFAVVVGIDGYRSLPPARGGERDAASLALHLRDALGLPEENIIVLTKDRASRADFSSVVEEWIPKNVSPDSRVYFYFAGHGTIDPVDQTAYLLPWDADLAFLQSSAYPLNRVFRNLEALRARQVIVFLDCCFGSDAERCRESRGLRPLVAYKETGPGPASKITVYFAASKKESAGVDQAAKAGLFTDALIEGLTGPAAERKSGTLTVEDLFLYIQKRVNTGAETQGRTQNPRLYTSSRDLRIY